MTDRRPTRAPLNPYLPYDFFVEEERAPEGEIVPVATVFLTNRECPFRCAMCDLWRNTLTETVPIGAIPTQIDHALGQLPPARHLKLYNSGNFFDTKAIPPDDHAAIAERANHFERLIVENHPALTGDVCLRFRDRLRGKFEIAMGLETTHPEVLARLKKGMTLQQFSRAAEFLRRNAIDLRVFILVQPPYMQPSESLHWAQRSLDFAMDCGATAATLIPTRPANGIVEFTPPPLSTLEDAMEYGLGLHSGRVFVDLWEFQQKSPIHPRITRLQQMNLTQNPLKRVTCEEC
jgi:archaeosine synthase beta-subunit